MSPPFGSAHPACKSGVVNAPGPGVADCELPPSRFSLPGVPHSLELNLLKILSSVFCAGQAGGLRQRPPPTGRFPHCIADEGQGDALLQRPLGFWVHLGHRVSAGESAAARPAGRVALNTLVRVIGCFRSIRAIGPGDPDWPGAGEGDPGRARPYPRSPPPGLRLADQDRVPAAAPDRPAHYPRHRPRRPAVACHARTGTPETGILSCSARTLLAQPHVYPSPAPGDNAGLCRRRRAWYVAWAAAGCAEGEGCTGLAWDG